MEEGFENLPERERPSYLLPEIHVSNRTGGLARAERGSLRPRPLNRHLLFTHEPGASGFSFTSGLFMEIHSLQDGPGLYELGV